MPNIFLDACESRADADNAAERRKDMGHQNVAVVDGVNFINRFLAVENGGIIEFTSKRTYMPSPDTTVNTPAFFVMSSK